MIGCKRKDVSAEPERRGALHEVRLGARERRRMRPADAFPAPTDGAAPESPPCDMAPPSYALRAKTSPLAFACEEPGDESEKTALLTAPSSPEGDWLSRLEADGAMDYRATLPVDKLPLAADLTRADEWEVLAPLGGACCSLSKPRMIEVVTLRRANYGLRWKAATAKRDQRNGGDAKPATPFCMVGPHWWLMAATFTVFLTAALVVTALTIPKARPGETAMGVLLSAACLTMYAKVGCSNPGIVEPLDAPLDDDYTYCGECESYRPPDALHCMDCRVCIEGYDHHCPWTGKCIGRRNVFYFYAWLFFLVLAFVYEMIEFTTYMLPPEDQPRPFPFDDDDDDSFSVRAGTIERTLAPPSFRQP